MSDICYTCGRSYALYSEGHSPNSIPCLKNQNDDLRNEIKHLKSRINNPEIKCECFNAIADIMSKPLSEEDWRLIYDATRVRMLNMHHDGEDTPSNRVLCEMDIMNALFDIRDYRDRLNGKIL
jgi:hypothetical protein